MKHRIRVFSHYHLKQKLAQLESIVPSKDHTPELFLKRNFLLTASGRWGISASSKTLALSPAHELYVAAPWSSPYVASCVTCTIFNVCKPSRVLSEMTKMIFIIHEFGLPHPETTGLVEYGRRKGMVVVEDCAHTFDSTLDDKLVGTFGDYAIYSLSKIFPMQDGGVVVADVLRFPEADNLDSNRTTQISEEFARYLPFSHHFSEMRRRNFSYLRDRLGGTVLRSGVSPYLFPLQVRGEASQIADRMARKGVECAIW